MLALLLAVLSFAGCARSDKVTSGNLGVIKDTEFGNIYIDGLSIEEFNELGFSFGDSLNIRFDNGKMIEDIPYYSGYNTPVGELLACGYPGYPHVMIARNYGDPTWDEFEMTDDSKVCVTLNEKGKYLSIEELYSLSYSDKREDYDSDEIFANFRAVEGGKLTKDAFYRSASPCDNQHNRASFANSFAESCGVQFVINLSDDETKYQDHTAQPDFKSEYYDGLYRKGNVLLLALNANYRSDKFAQAISQAFLTMTKHDGPALIHCVEGKDRTGFACALLLALADASAQEIIDDYMITYANYYGIIEQTKPEKYNAILGDVNDFLYCLCDAQKGTPVDTLDLKDGAKSYLRRGGLTEEQIAAVEKYITR